MIKTVRSGMCPAMYLAVRVFPVPGGPCKSSPIDVLPCLSRRTHGEELDRVSFDAFQQPLGRMIELRSMSASGGRER